MHAIAMENMFLLPVPGIDEDDVSPEEPSSAPIEDMPPLEGDEDASRMEEVDWERADAHTIMFAAL